MPFSGDLAHSTWGSGPPPTRWLSRFDRGHKMKIDVSNEEHAEFEDVAAKVVKVLMQNGADASNASLLAATLLYWAGTNSRLPGYLPPTASLAGCVEWRPALLRGGGGSPRCLRKS